MAYAVRDQGLALVGYSQLQRALARVEERADFGLAYELQRRLKLIGEAVAEAAPRYVSHKTGRHAEGGNPRLEDSVRVSVTTKQASVYSTAEHGGVQNVGGKVGRDHATLLTRASVSHWMNRAVSGEREYVKTELDGLLGWLLSEFEADVAGSD